MNNPTMETLARRLDKVERENRWLKQAGVVALAVIAAVVLMGQATPTKVPERIEAKRFIVVDDGGRHRAILEVGDRDFPQLVLLDKTGDKEVLLAGGTKGLEGGSLWLLGKHGMDLAYLASQPSGATLRLHGKGGASGVGVVLRSGDIPGLALVDKHGKERIQLFVEAGQSNLSLYDENGTKRAALVATSAGPALAFLDENKNHRMLLISLPTRTTLDFNDTKGNPGLELSFDEDEPSIRLSGKGEAVLGNVSVETTKTGVVEKRPTSSIVLFNKAGKLIWSAP